MNTQHNQPAKGNSNSAPSDQDLWDAAFASDDPTVVLTAEDLQQAASRRAESRTADEEATRAFPSPIPAPSPQDDGNASEEGESAFSWLNTAGSGSSGSGTSAGSASAPNAAASTASAPNVPEHRGTQNPNSHGTAPGVTPQGTPQNTAPRAPEQPASAWWLRRSLPAGQPAQPPVIQPSEPVLTAATALQMQKERYSRMHMLPGLLGWLVAITLIDGGRWGYRRLAHRHRAGTIPRVPQRHRTATLRRILRHPHGSRLEHPHLRGLPHRRIRRRTHDAIRRNQTGHRGMAMAHHGPHRGFASHLPGAANLPERYRRILHAAAHGRGRV